MTSFLAWLDYSEAERRKANEVLQALREPGVLDELGLGAVWEPLADLLFPGTSTIQTRARYFLFIPWIFRNLEQRRVGATDASRRAQQLEVELIEQLVASGERRGVIGIDARRNLQRFPSAIYWRGLHQLGIRIFAGSMGQYFRSLSTAAGSAELLQDDTRDVVLGTERWNWHPSLPPTPRPFPRGATFQLSVGEAAYLRERILATHPDSLLAYLASAGVVADVPFPWEHPATTEASAQNRNELLHARLFSEVMHGAVLLYNLMLAQAAGQADWTEKYVQLLDAWAESVERPNAGVTGWDLEAFWRLVVDAGGRARPRTQKFVAKWVDCVRAGARSVTTDDEARRLIKDREFALKQSRARLTYQRALDRWGGESGTWQIDYRWSNASRLLSDIAAGLQHA